MAKRRALTETVGQDRAKTEAAFVAAGEPKPIGSEAVTVRLPTDLVEKLRAAAGSRWASKQEPYRISHIVAAGVELWLDQNGGKV
jgi:uncharacterized protein (DUF4415 family)